MNKSTQFSFWELSEFLGPKDLIIIGSGIVGLSAALYYKTFHPQSKIIIIEAGRLPQGASSKNAGFACIGSLSELIDDLSTNSFEEIIQLMRERKNGLDALFRNVSPRKMDFHRWGGFEIFDEKDSYEKCMKYRGQFNKAMADITQLKETFIPANRALKTFGFDGVNHMIKNRFEGQINTGKMLMELVTSAWKKGIYILNNTRVESFMDLGEKVELVLDNRMTIYSKKVLICSNGFARQLLPELDVHPARAQVLITEKIDSLPVKGTFHYDRGYFYFRNIDGRILLGGGRNLDFETETTTDFSLNSTIQQALEELLFQKIIPNRKVNIEHRWTGIMGVGKIKRPIIKKISNNIACSVRMGGMGVALGTNAGQEGAKLLI
jgi:gamma-glutamylputrescine oxidase